MNYSLTLRELTDSNSSLGQKVALESLQLRYVILQFTGMKPLAGVQVK